MWYSFSPLAVFKHLGGFFLVILILWILILLNPAIWYESPERRQEAIVKSGIHEIQLALETSAYNDGGLYPTAIQDLIGRGHLSSFPRNSFTRQEMRRVPWGQRSAGDFSYWVSRDHKALCIAAYGGKMSQGINGTGIIVFYTNGFDTATLDKDELAAIPEVCRRDLPSKRNPAPGNEMRR